ncbi:unnamed protein product [Dovyalis caffra]|uniref:Uncharacterized protein n=1 Tax=Dovyalis caffra TaxID=77055 RepID=A0AAV1RHI7_9ROSI|nr:unnamed protein product [Dovyalis caffra]
MRSNNSSGCHVKKSTFKNVKSTTGEQPELGAWSLEDRLGPPLEGVEWKLRVQDRRRTEEGNKAKIEGRKKDEDLIVEDSKSIE